MNKKNLLFTCFLLAVFLITSTLALVTAKKVTKIHASSATNPDFFMTNAVYTKFGKDGHIRNQVSAPKITHFVTNNIYLFEHPKITMYNPNEQPWNITADKGKGEQGKDKIDLWDNVKILRIADRNNPDFNIATSAITIYPDIKFAETKLPITIIQEGNITKAIGAKADFKSGVIKLLSKIEGVYQVQ